MLYLLYFHRLTMSHGSAVLAGTDIASGWDGESFQLTTVTVDTLVASEQAILRFDDFRW
jgi:hypothetical protein